MTNRSSIATCVSSLLNNYRNRSRGNYLASAYKWPKEWSILRANELSTGILQRGTACELLLTMQAESIKLSDLSPVSSMLKCVVAIDLGGCSHLWEVCMQLHIKDALVYFFSTLGLIITL